MAGKKFLKKIREKRGGGSILAFAISMIVLVILLLSVFTVANAVVAGDSVKSVANTVARELVTCSGIDDARITAESMVSKLLEQGPYEAENTVVSVGFAPGCESTWIKGNFIQLVIGTDIKAAGSAVTVHREESRTVMIEWSGAYDNR